jgi:dTDP-4-dehydrorhamnose 3,5-epimerase
MFDVAVDIRRGSPCFGRWVGVTLSGDNFRQLYIPPGFAHGFCVLSDEVDVEYKCTDFYDPSDEITVLWSDPRIAIDWPVASPSLSKRDMEARPLLELSDRLPAFDG